MSVANESHAALRHGVHVGAYVPPALHRALEVAARRHERTVSAELRLAIRRHLASPHVEWTPVGVNTPAQAGAVDADPGAE